MLILLYARYTVVYCHEPSEDTNHQSAPIWRDVRGNGKDKLVREFENCENETELMGMRSRELMRELVLRLVRGANLVKDDEVFSQ